MSNEHLVRCGSYLGAAAFEFLSSTCEVRRS